MTVLPRSARHASTPSAQPSGDDDPFGAFLAGPRLRLPALAHGPLSGLRFAVQDLIDVEGAVTGAGNPDWAAARGRADRSAAAVTQCLAAGAALVGKTVTDELGFSLEGSNPHFGAPINPRDPDALAGGSAAGSAAAVAAGLADFALGVDSGGSVRAPAAFCGLWGFRPTKGRVPTDGITPFAPSFDTIGWMARTGATLQAVGDALLGEDQDDTPLTDLRLARDALEVASPDVADAVARVAAGWTDAPPLQAFPGLWHDHLRLYAHAQAADLCAGLGREVAAVRPRLGPDAAQRFAAAMAAEPSVIEAWSGFRRAARAWFDLTMPPGRVMILPTASAARLPRTAGQDVLGDFYVKTLALMAIAGAAGAPQIHIPMPGGGVSLIARQGADRRLIDRAVSLAGETA